MSMRVQNDLNVEKISPFLQQKKKIQFFVNIGEYPKQVLYIEMMSCVQAKENLY